MQRIKNLYDLFETSLKDDFGATGLPETKSAIMLGKFGVLPKKRRFTAQLIFIIFLGTTFPHSAYKIHCYSKYKTYYKT